MRCHRSLRIVPILVIVGASLAACGDDETSSPTTTEGPAATTTPTTSPTSVSPSTDSTATTPPATTPATTSDTTTTVPVPTGTPSLWPPDGATTPEEAVSAFVSEFLNVDPNIGEFRAGDARSGEIDVLGPAEAPGVRATAFVRRLGPDDAWFVTGAASDGVEITTPETGDSVPAGPLILEGLGRGFESTIGVRALLNDADATELDAAIGAGGPFGELQPYDVILDLSDAQPGDIVILLARGDTGLSDDPGEFTAIAVVIE